MEGSGEFKTDAYEATTSCEQGKAELWYGFDCISIYLLIVFFVCRVKLYFLDQL